MSVPQTVPQALSATEQAIQEFQANTESMVRAGRVRRARLCGGQKNLTPPRRTRSPRTRGSAGRPRRSMVRSLVWRALAPPLSAVAENPAVLKKYAVDALVNVAYFVQRICGQLDGLVTAELRELDHLDLALKGLSSRMSAAHRLAGQATLVSMQLPRGYDNQGAWGAHASCWWFTSPFFCRRRESEGGGQAVAGAAAASAAGLPRPGRSGHAAHARLRAQPRRGQHVA